MNMFSNYNIDQKLDEEIHQSYIKTNRWFFKISKSIKYLFQKLQKLVHYLKKYNNTAVKNINIQKIF